MMLRQSMARWFKQTPLFHSNLYRYHIAPTTHRIVYEIQRRITQPALSLCVVKDIRPLAHQRGWPLQIIQPAAIQERQASHTIADEVLDLIRRGNQRVENMHETQLRWNRPRSIGEMYYSHLYAQTRYHVGETFTCEIPHALVTGRGGLVVSTELEVLAQSSFDPATGVTQPIVRQHPRQREALPGLYLSLISQTWSTNYSHWLVDSLTRLDLIDPQRNDYRVILPYKAPRFQRETLQLLGIDDSRIIELDQRYGQIAVERLLLSVAQERSTVPHIAHLRSIRERLLQAALGQERPARPWRRIYISRANSTRRLHNEKELLPLLAEYGFEVVRTEELNMRDEIQLFAEAQVVLGASGAGMINPLFSAPGTIVIEIYNRQRWSHCFARVLSLLGHQHWHIFGEDVGGDWDTYIAPAKLRKVLRYALEGAGPDLTLYDDPF